MIHRYPVALTTLEEDFRSIGLLPDRELSEADDAEDPRDIPSPDPSTSTGGAPAGGARHKYAKQPKQKMAPDDGNGGHEPLDAGAARGKSSGSYKRVAGNMESVAYPSGYKALKSKIMQNVKDTGQAPAVAQGLPPVKGGLGKMKPQKIESTHLTRAAELVHELESMVSASQVNEEAENLAHGFALIGENSSLLTDRLIDLAESFDVDDVIAEMETLYANAAEAYSIIESLTDEDDLEDIKEAFKVMTLQLMDAVEKYDITLSEMSDDDDDDDDSDDDDDDDDSDDDDDDSDDDDDKGDDEDDGVAAKLAALKAKGKGRPFGK